MAFWSFFSGIFKYTILCLKYIFLISCWPETLDRKIYVLAKLFNEVKTKQIANQRYSTYLFNLFKSDVLSDALYIPGAALQTLSQLITWLSPPLPIQANIKYRNCGNIYGCVWVLVVELEGGGSATNGATLSSLHNIFIIILLIFFISVLNTIIIKFTSKCLSYLER